MRPSPDRRLVILTEGQFRAHNAKTALGVMRYGRDTVVALLDSSIAGHRASEYVGPDPRFDVPAVATLDEALAFRPDALLIGIAPTGGRLPPDWRATILAALGAGLDVLSGLHTFIGDDPEFVAAAASSGARIVDYRRPPDRLETAVGRLHGPGKHVILTVGTDCAIGKMSVALELRRAALEAGLTRRLRADRPDRDDDRGLGRRGRPGDRRLPPGHDRVARRGGRGAGRLDHRRGPGLARPPGLLVASPSG